MAQVTDPRAQQALLALLRGANVATPNYQGPPGIDQAPSPPANWQEMVDPAVLQPTQGPQVAPEPVPVSSVSQDIQGTEDIGAKALEKFQHKGLFGVKGTLRDILGILGDGLTGRMTYSTARRGEKYGDILAGGYQNNEEENFVNNPLLTIQRLGEEGFGQEAASLYQDYVKNEQAKQAAAINEARLARQENRDDVMAAEGEVRRQKGIQDIAARTYGGIQDEATLAQFNERFRPILEKNGLGHIPLPKNLREAKVWGIDTYRSNVLEDKDRSLGIQQQNANTNAARPTPRPRADTPLEYFRQVSAIPADQRTPEQNAFFKKYITSGRGGGGRTGTIGGSSGGPKSPVGSAIDTALSVATGGRPGDFRGQTRKNKKTGVTQTWDGTRWK